MVKTLGSIVALLVFACIPPAGAEVDASLFCIMGSRCVGLTCTDSGDLRHIPCSESARCGLGRWGVTLSFTGTGVVVGNAVCGGDVVAACEARSPANTCDSGLESGGSGSLACIYAVMEGEVADVSGYCYDPYVPDAPAVPMIRAPPTAEASVSGG